MEAFFGDIPVTVLDVQTIGSTTQALITLDGTETWVPWTYLDTPLEQEQD